MASGDFPKADQTSWDPDAYFARMADVVAIYNPDPMHDPDWVMFRVFNPKGTSCGVFSTRGQDQTEANLAVLLKQGKRLMDNRRAA